MAVKFNKDVVIKHRFWILLGIAIPLIVAGQFLLLVPVAGQIATDRQKVDAKVKEGKAAAGSGPFYNEENIQKKLKQVESVQKKELQLWENLFKEQAGLTFWPTKFEEIFPMNNGKFIREVKYVEGGASPVPDDVHHLTGRLLSRDNNSITVQTKDGKKERFYRMGRDEMKFDGGFNFFDLPLDKDVQITFQTGMYFNDKLSDTQRSNYAAQYASQIRPILDIVEPVNEEGEGVVILRDWPVPKRASELPPRETTRFLRFVTPPWVDNHDISEEAWLAQEDLWIQKELYRLVRQANDYVGKLEGTPVAALNQEAVFKNTYFELKLKLATADKLEVTIKNLQDHRLKLEVRFRVRFDKDSREPEKIMIEGEPLDPAGTVDAKKNPKDTLKLTLDLPNGPKRTGIYGVEQALTWETAAVRRIDHIAIGHMSGDEFSLNHRVFPEGVKPLVPPPPVEPAAADAEPGKAPPAPAVPDPRMFNAGPGRFPGPGFPGNQNMNLTINGLLKDRYSEEPTEQTRRLPVAITLIVDQDHIDRVLTSFGNSKLRFVLNQMLVNRYPLSVRPQTGLNDGKFMPGGVFPPRGPMPPRPFGPVPVPGPGRLPVGMPGGLTGDEEVEANVELILYGTVTLYQRFPPRTLPKAEEAAPKG